MSIYSSAVKKPITTLMIFLGLVVFGLYSMVNLPVNLYPEMEPPFLTVYTFYGGANASDIETNVTKVLEDQLNSVTDLKEINSVSRDNFSVITLEFEWETNLDEAANDVRDAFSWVESALPEDCEDPLLFKFNSSSMPILFCAITADESFSGLEKIAEEKLINPMNRIDGIGSIGLAGAPGREIYIEIDPVKLEAYNMTLEQIGSVIGAENLNMPSGDIEMGKMSYPFRVKGEFRESEEISNLTLGTFNNKTILLKDVAIVRDSIRDLKIDQRINGKQSIQFYVMKQSGANSTQVANDVKEKLVEVKKTMPPDVDIKIIWDTSTFIENSIGNLTQTLMWALFFVVLVVMFFLGRWRATFIVVLTIPISLIVAFIYLRLTGNTINIISLSSLSIAIGMVVDDAIVVLENISKHIDRGSSPREAAIYGTNEVWLAVIVTTLTVVAVFFPLTLVTGLTGVIFKDLGWIVTITTVTSTVAAITLTPMLSSRLLRLKPPRLRKNGNAPRFSYQSTIGKLLDALDLRYQRTLRWCLRRKWLVTIIAVLIFIVSMSLMRSVGTEFIPETDESNLNITVELQTGTRVDETVRIARQLDSVFSNKYPEINMISTASGSDDNAGMTALFTATGYHIINYRLKLVRPDERDISVWDLAEKVRTDLDNIPEIVKYNVTTQDGMAMGGDNQVDVQIFGYDFNNTTNLAMELADKLKVVEGAKDVSISREEEKPELQLILDREKLAMHGLTTAQVSAAMRNRVDGLIATRFREEGDEYDVIVRFQEEFRNSITAVENIGILTPSGSTVRIKELGTVKEYWSPPNIERKRRERLVTVSAKPYKKSLGELAVDIQAVVDDTEIPQGIMVEVGGAYEDQQESFADLGLLMVLVLVLVYLIMASQFESFKLPFIIMLSIPFAFTGVVLALYITGVNLSVIAGLGAVMLIGIVVKNAIVLVDYINLMRDRGHALNDAIEISGGSRLRPVLMTSFTTILGMMPMALSQGEGAEIWRPMGIAVIGGLLVSTFITLIIVPVFYALFSRRGQRDKKLKVRSRYNFLNIESNESSNDNS